MSYPTLSCWKCGAVAEVDEWIEVTRFGDPEPRYLPRRVDWPRECVEGLGGHDYHRPSPDELAAAGRRAIDTINRITLEALL